MVDDIDLQWFAFGPPRRCPLPEEVVGRKRQSTGLLELHYPGWEIDVDELWSTVFSFGAQRLLDYIPVVGSRQNPHFVLSG
jgi:hypothetical protein